MSEGPRFSNKQVFGAVLALCLAIAIAPAGAVAANNAFSISDPVYAKQKARVDSAGRLLVRSGGGTLTVDGTVRTINPANTWFLPPTLMPIQGSYDITPYSTVPIALADFTIRNLAFSSNANVSVIAGSAPVTSSNTRCEKSPYSTVVWRGGVGPSATLFVPFAVPLRTAPSGNLKVCFFATSIGGGGDPEISANGYYGG